MEDQEFVQEFLIESHENLSRVEKEILALEEHPGDGQILGSIFRSFHTVKGTCGFLGFGKLEMITHQAESLLGELREGRRKVTPAIASLILETLDSVQIELASIESTGNESDIAHTQLLLKLQHALESEEGAAMPVMAPAALPSEPEPEAATDEPASEEKSGDGSGQTAKAGNAIVDQTVRVDTRLVDRLINLVGELVLVRNQVLQNGVGGERNTDKAVIHRLNLITSELQEGVMRSRMQPVGTIWGKLPRLVRDSSAQLKKEIALVMDGANTEMDRTILEAVKDPLTHILRNSCDHGLEPPADRAEAKKRPQGQVSLRAYHEGGQVVMEVEDDGRGIDPAKLRAKSVEKGILTQAAANALSDRDAIQLIFHAGFSTAEKITNISGRGVGMDVVKKNIQSIGGQVEIHSRVGVGTKVKIRIPLTLAIIPGLTVSSSGQTFVVPQTNLVELLRLQGESQSAIETNREGNVLRWRETLIPLVDLNETLSLKQTVDRGDVKNVTILEAEGSIFGLVLDRIHAVREIVVKPLGKQLKRLNWYAGATILGDGSVALILDVAGLARKENVASRTATAAADTKESGGAKTETEQFLLFACGSASRVSIPLGLVDRLEKFSAEVFERTVDGRVVQYRGSLLRVVSLAQVLGTGGEECFEQKHVSVIVVRQNERTIGLAVDRIIDVQNGTIEAPSQTSAMGLLATFVLNGVATELLDLPKVLDAADPVWTQERWIARPAGAPVLLETSSRFLATSLRHYLELGGYPTEISTSPEQTLRRLGSGSIRALLLDWGPETDEATLAAIQAASQNGGFPVVAVCEEPCEGIPPWLTPLHPTHNFAALLRLLQPEEATENGTKKRKKRARR